VAALEIWPSMGARYPKEWPIALTGASPSSPTIRPSMNAIRHMNGK